VNLTDSDLHAAYYCTAEVVRSRRLGCRPIPAEVRRLYDRLTAEMQPGLSRSGQEKDCGGQQLSAGGWMSAAEAASLLGWSKRRVQRHATDLDGEIIGGRWLFRQSTVIEYAEGKQDARPDEGGDRAAPRRPQ
jgi:hypothetical protein